ncbi:unnamed protein product [Prorocentrum cordatum]|uniref:Uncharacterized protein n=1 Tax=Prorocentrum cordatum TaxID=2364126 RepID=A0ABN9VMZ4_9DINO|nr:unnamed protein product [Polarella glacialis]
MHPPTRARSPLWSVATEFRPTRHSRARRSRTEHRSIGDRREASMPPCSGARARRSREGVAGWTCVERGLRRDPWVVMYQCGTQEPRRRRGLERGCFQTLPQRPAGERGPDVPVLCNPAPADTTAYLGVLEK